MDVWKSEFLKKSMKGHNELHHELFNLYKYWLFIVPYPKNFPMRVLSWAMIHGLFKPLISGQGYLNWVEGIRISDGTEVKEYGFG